MPMKTARNTYRFAVGIAVAAAFLLAWVSAGVGLIGADGDPANWMYLSVFFAGAVGTARARLRPHGMAGALIAMAVAQAVVAAIALIGGLGRPWSEPLEIIFSNGFFAALFLLSAWLFRRAATFPATNLEQK